MQDLNSRITLVSAPVSMALSSRLSGSGLTPTTEGISACKNRYLSSRVKSIERQSYESGSGWIRMPDMVAYVVLLMFKTVPTYLVDRYLVRPLEKSISTVLIENYKTLKKYTFSINPFLTLMTHCGTSKTTMTILYMR